MAFECGLLPLDLDNFKSEKTLITAALSLPDVSSLYLYFRQGTAVTKGADDNVLATLAQCYDLVANTDPERNVIPLFPFAGWAEVTVANIPELQSILSADDGIESATHLLHSLNLNRQTPFSLNVERLSNVEPLSEPSTAGREDRVVVQEERQYHQFQNVAVGGTFDHLHAGHRLLLAVTALVCTNTVWLGVTGDELLAAKSHRELVQPYSHRRDGAIQFMKYVRPKLHFVVGALLDPKEPTFAETKPDMDALVVSRETLEGGEAINRGRQARGLRPLALIIVDLVGSASQEPGAKKLSSTALREAHAARKSSGGQKRPAAG